MTVEELRLLADKCEREGLTDAEVAKVTADIIQTHLANKEGSAQLRIDTDRMSDIFNRRIPQLMNRCVEAEAAAGCMLSMLREYLSDDEIRLEIAKRIAAAESSNEGVM